MNVFPETFEVELGYPGICTNQFKNRDFLTTKKLSKMVTSSYLLPDSWMISNFSGTLPLIYSHPWFIYMQICKMEAYFLCLSIACNNGKLNIESDFINIWRCVTVLSFKTKKLKTTLITDHSHHITNKKYPNENLLF